MKIFIREHALLIIVQTIQMTMITAIFWFAGFRDMKLILYSIFLGLFLLLCYLLYQYWSRRKFYHRLGTSIQSLDESLEKLDAAIISESLEQLLKSQYAAYQEQIMQLKNKQGEHLIFIDRFVHQMKTPLSVIELMAKDLDEPASSSFREESDRLKMGLQMVLYMARLRSIEQDINIQSISLNELVQDVQEDNKRLFISNHIFPKVNINREGISVESDEKWLFFIVSQLIHNAVKYSEGRSQQIIITLDEDTNGVLLEVRDFGVGIPKEDINRIFDAFYTGENGRHFRESTGVGLYLAKEVATYLGHHIEVDSTVGHGTTLRIIFSLSKG